MSKLLSIYKAQKSDIKWINSKYQEIGFEPSVFDREDIYILKYNGLNAGIGRFVFFQDQHIEMGGILIFAEYRTKGLASHLVKSLVESQQYEKFTIWCIPYFELVDFYSKFGFKLVNEEKGDIPSYLVEKLMWIRKLQKQNVRLMKLYLLE